MRKSEEIESTSSDETSPKDLPMEQDQKNFQLNKPNAESFDGTSPMQRLSIE